ncbi:hypothetical protein ACE6H2_017035 [Prunus campanulata]
MTCPLQRGAESFALNGLGEWQAEFQKSVGVNNSLVKTSSIKSFRAGGALLTEWIQRHILGGLKSKPSKGNRRIMFGLNSKPIK